jgi:DTW domain-containing protein YfiP
MRCAVRAVKIICVLPKWRPVSAQSGDTDAAAALELWFDVFSDHYLRAKQQLPADWTDAQHQQLLALGDAAAKAATPA